MNDVRVWCIRSLRNDDILEADGLTEDQEFVTLDDYKALEARVKELTDICTKSSHEIEQILGRSLGYPRFCDDQKNFPGTTDADGVAVGEHVAATLAAEAADRINHLNTRVKELEAALAAKENA